MSKISIQSQKLISDCVAKNGAQSLYDWALQVAQLTNFKSGFFYMDFPALLKHLEQNYEIKKS